MKLKNNKQKKYFEHNPIEQCNISKEPIDTLTERFSIILDCDGEQITSIRFYKLNRLRDLITGKGKIIMNDFLKRQREVVGNVLKNSPLNKYMGLSQ